MCCIRFCNKWNEDAPLVKLFDFQRIYVQIGQSVNVTLSIAPESISLTNQLGNERIVPGLYDIFIGDYPNNNYIKTQFLMYGKEESIFNDNNYDDDDNTRIKQAFDPLILWKIMLLLLKKLKKKIAVIHHKKKVNK